MSLTKYSPNTGQLSRLKVVCSAEGDVTPIIALLSLPDKILKPPSSLPETIDPIIQSTNNTSELLHYPILVLVAWPKITLAPILVNGNFGATSPIPQMNEANPCSSGVLSRPPIFWRVHDRDRVGHDDEICQAYEHKRRCGPHRVEQYAPDLDEEDLAHTADYIECSQ